VQQAFSLLIACALCAFATLRVYGYAINAAIFLLYDIWAEPMLPRPPRVCSS